MKSKPTNAYQQLEIIMSKLPKKYQKITIEQALNSTDEKLDELKQWCIAFNKYQFNNALNNLKNEENITNISNSINN